MIEKVERNLCRRLGRYRVGIGVTVWEPLKNRFNFRELRGVFGRDQLKVSQLYSFGSLRRFPGGLARCLLAGLGFVDFGEEFVCGNINILTLLTFAES